MAGAVAMGYSNIFVTAPSPENLNTLFEFVFKGLDAMDYKVRISPSLSCAAQHRNLRRPDPQPCVYGCFPAQGVPARSVYT